MFAISGLSGGRKSASYTVIHPPSYNEILRSACEEELRATVLSRICDIVSSLNFTSSSFALILDSCAAALPLAAEFPDLLQQPNIEDHTALYWAIVNNRREALWAFITFISHFPSVCTSDLRLACMTVHDHTLFMELNLGGKNTKDESLRLLLGCPPDGI
ncbi:uncharacterized protein EDB91DRAFT_641197 [Suillus paluster]|uniref:uncharacterized protein n=1 Tax=Suillus paluster TaxID=48578 RepID=UPI001B8865EE|nr:uncharacterized protein EDB91DRAFT_641197 [Suillus paluster]KAG1733356.1 hypothetical protein EDB91DRAFT_641197 [Suillus paluster]